jgi:hypothetical protein
VPQRMIALLPLLFLATAVQANKTEAEECIYAKVSDQYSNSWQLRTRSSLELNYGGTRHYQATLLKGQSYQVLTCADDNVRDLDILLYNSKGEIILRDSLDNREPTLEFIPAATGTYFVTLYVRSMVDYTQESSVAFALMHK